LLHIEYHNTKTRIVFLTKQSMNYMDDHVLIFILLQFVLTYIIKCVCVCTCNITLDTYMPDFLLLLLSFIIYCAKHIQGNKSRLTYFIIIVSRCLNIHSSPANSSYSPPLIRTQFPGMIMPPSSLFSHRQCLHNMNTIDCHINTPAITTTH